MRQTRKARNRAYKEKLKLNPVRWAAFKAKKIKDNVKRARKARSEARAKSKQDARDFVDALLGPR